MRTFALDENNDMMLDRQGNLAITEGIKATAQTSRNFASTRTGEAIHAIDVGVPFFMTAFDHFPNLAQFEAALRRRLLQVGTVTAVTALDVQYADGSIKYTATLATTDGQVTING